ncbi:hypothetical protein JB92DRAFT_2970323 [Gautieria morchelliformis]|nr:hypothetical protein JB92DRAFT_2970323 [Gautieria morchelliformis]
MGSVGTPSKALARTLAGIILDAESQKEDDDIKLGVGTHGERRHASIHKTLEYCLEIDPRELVARAKTEIKDSNWRTSPHVCGQRDLLDWPHRY